MPLAGIPSSHAATAYDAAPVLAGERQAARQAFVVRVGSGTFRHDHDPRLDGRRRDQTVADVSTHRSDPGWAGKAPRLPVPAAAASALVANQVMVQELLGPPPAERSVPVAHGVAAYWAAGRLGGAAQRRLDPVVLSPDGASGRSFDILA